MIKKGFTLIELMVTVTIMMIMTAIVLFGYNQFNESTILSSLAYDMSLTIRQAQVYGIASREGTGSNQGNSIGATSFNNFNNPYGVHFDTTNSLAFSLFVDGNVNNVLDSSGLDTVLQSYSFQRNISIKSLCVVVGISGSCNLAKTLDITFIRPNPEEIIRATDFNTGMDLGTNSSSATITMQNSDGSLTKSVVVTSTGQISVQ